MIFAGLCWLGILVQPRSERLSFCDTSVWTSLSSDKIFALLEGSELFSLTCGWVLMVGAMMTPMLTRNVAHVRARSMPALRTAGTAFFFLGYLAVWLLAAIPAAVIMIPVELVQPAGGPAFASIALVPILWQFSPAKQSCLNRCHRTPVLSATGINFATSVFGYGFGQGTWCCGTCWALMLLTLFAGDAHVMAMFLASTFLLAERLEAPARPTWKARFPTVFIRVISFQLKKFLRQHPSPLK